MHNESRAIYKVGVEVVRVKGNGSSAHINSRRYVPVSEMTIRQNQDRRPCLDCAVRAKMAADSFFDFSSNSVLLVHFRDFEFAGSVFRANQSLFKIKTPRKKAGTVMMTEGRRKRFFACFG